MQAKQEESQLPKNLKTDVSIHLGKIRYYVRIIRLKCYNHRKLYRIKIEGGKFPLLKFQM